MSKSPKYPAYRVKKDASAFYNESDSQLTEANDFLAVSRGARTLSIPSCTSAPINEALASSADLFLKWFLTARSGHRSKRTLGVARAGHVREPAPWASVRRGNRRLVGPRRLDGRHPSISPSRPTWLPMLNELPLDSTDRNGSTAHDARRPSERRAYTATTSSHSTAVVSQTRAAFNANESRARVLDLRPASDSCRTATRCRG